MVKKYTTRTPTSTMLLETLSTTSKQEGSADINDIVRQGGLGLLTTSATYDAASLADGATTTTTLTQNGAVLGDFCMASLSVSAAGMAVTTYISATSTQTVVINNESGTTVDLSSATLSGVVFPKTFLFGT